MFEPSKRMRSMEVIAKLTYIICVVVGILEGVVCGVCFGSAFGGGSFNWNVAFIVGIIGSIVFGLLGYFVAWLIDLISYTTVVRFDEILLELREKTALDIKTTLEKIEQNTRAPLMSQSAAVASGTGHPPAAGTASPATANTVIVQQIDVNAKDEERKTDLMKAIVNNEGLEAIKALIDAGANVNARDADGKTALIYAAQYCTDACVVKALVDAGADVNAKDWDSLKTVLMYAAWYSTDASVVQTLLDAGADKKAQDNNGRRALQYLEMRRDYGTFCNTDAYQKMRQLLQ